MAPDITVVACGSEIARKLHERGLIELARLARDR
jgi:hypothetical protein